MNLFDPAPKPDLAAGRRVKEWTRELLALGDDVTLTVSELRCTEAGCPAVETVIGALFAPGRQRRWKVLAPIAAVTREQLAAVFAEFPPDR
jgi:hypothetical protein